MVQLVEFAPAFGGEAELLVAAGLGELQQRLGNGVADIFEIDGEVGELVAALGLGFAGIVDLGEIELDLGLGLVEGLFQRPRLLDLLGVAGLVEFHQRLQHALDDLGHAQQIAGS